MVTSVENVPLQSFKMPFSNAGFQRWPEKKQWLWRVVMIFLTVLNAWEWFHDIALGRTAAAVIDAVFEFVILCVIIASFFGGGKNAIQGR